MTPSRVSEVTRPTVSVPKVGLLMPRYPTELSNCPARLESALALWRVSALPLFCTSERGPLTSSPEYGSNPVSNAPTRYQFGIQGIASLILIPTTDWLIPLGVNSHLDAVALLAHETVNAVGIRRAPGRAVRAVAEAYVDRRIDRDARVAQGALRGACAQIVPEARKAVHRRRRLRGLRGRQIRRLCDPAEADCRRKCDDEFLHMPAPTLCRVKSIVSLDFYLCQCRAPPIGDCREVRRQEFRHVFRATLDRPPSVAMGFDSRPTLKPILLKPILEFDQRLDGRNCDPRYEYI